MGSDQSTVNREQENARIVAELERRRYELERQLQEELRSEREKNRRRLEREEKLREQLRLERERNRRVEHDDFTLVPSLEEQQLEEAIRRSIIETQLYPNLDSTAGSSRQDTYQNTAAPYSTLNHSAHITLLTDPPRRVVNPMVNNPPETRPRPPFSRASTHKSVTGTGAAAPRADTARTATNRASAAAPAPHDNKVYIRKDDNTLCKTCKKPYGEKIFQCKNGHSSCESCWTLDMPCGVCRGPITMTRNFDLENYFAANQQVKCPNEAEGCILTFKKFDLPKHERVCPFKELKCPALSHCNWKGKISQLSVHFDEEHPTSRQANVDTEMYLPITCYEYNSLQLIKLGNFNFLFYVKVSEMESRIYMDVQLIGTKAAASKWYYEIHVYNKREPCRKYLYSDVCRSLQEITSDISLRNCAILPLSYAMGFINEGTLAYKVYIIKNSELRRRRRYGKTTNTPGTSNEQS